MPSVIKDYVYNVAGALKDYYQSLEMEVFQINMSMNSFTVHNHVIIQDLCPKHDY